MANVVEILVKATNLTGPAMAEVNASVNKTGKGMGLLNKTAGLAAAGFIAFGVESVKMASKFDSQMNMLTTQAGVSKEKVAGLKAGVLDLAGKVGQDPDSLAEALYHVESNFASMGISSKKALDLTKIAAEGATVGNADLVDVTNALTAAVASGIPGVGNMSQAMGVLNATVGAGDMKMQDLASAFGTGMLATVKGFGLSITDVGAALATFGDNNIRGAKAGTQLRMTVQSLAAPAAGGAAELGKLGLTANSLANDMQSGGLLKALQDLKAHMVAAGVAADQQGQVITEVFGKKAGTGVNILIDQLTRLESKYPELQKGATGFDAAWKQTTQTFAFQMKSMKTGLEALAISFGEKLIPPIQATIGFLKDNRAAAIGATEALAGLAAGAVLVSTGMKAITITKTLWGGVTIAITAVKSAMESAALSALYMQDAFVAAGGGAAGLTAAVGTLSTTLKTTGLIALAAGAAYAWQKFGAASKDAHVSADDMSASIQRLGSGKDVSGLIKRLTGDVSDMHRSLVQKLESNDSVWDLVTNSGPKTSAAKKDFKELGQTLTELVQNGDANIAAKAVERLTAAGVKIPTDVMDKYHAALKDVSLQADLTAQSQGRFGDEAKQVSMDMKAQQDVADGLRQSIQALDKAYQDSFDTETKLYDAFAAGTQAIKDNGHTLDLNTAAGRKNRDALSAIAQAADANTSAMEANGESQDSINRVYVKSYNNLIKTAEGMGLNTRQAKALVGQLLHIPKDIKIKTNADGTIKDISNIKAAVASLTGKTIRINVNTVTTTTTGGVFHEGGGYAHGGEIGAAATGGNRNGLTLVGEHGPELVRLPGGSTVHSNPDSQRMMAAGGNGGAPLLVVLQMDGRKMAEVLVNPLRRTIRHISGGSVQAALGHGG